LSATRTTSECCVCVVTTSECCVLPRGQQVSGPEGRPEGQVNRATVLSQGAGSEHAGHAMQARTCERRSCACERGERWWLCVRAAARQPSPYSAAQPRVQRPAVQRGSRRGPPAQRQPTSASQWQPCRQLAPCCKL